MRIACEITSPLFIYSHISPGVGTSSLGILTAQLDCSMFSNGTHSCPGILWKFQQLTSCWRGLWQVYIVNQEIRTTWQHHQSRILLLPEEQREHILKDNWSSDYFWPHSFRCIILCRLGATPGGGRERGTPDLKWWGGEKDFFWFEIHDSGIFGVRKFWQFVIMT